MDLHLHIGTEKTGTTSVQRLMSLNRELLKGRKILYPEAPGKENHLALTAISRERRSEIWNKLGIKDREDSERFRDEFRTKLEHELKTGPFTRVVMSGEHCSSRLRFPEEVERLRDFLRPFFERIVVVVYLRRQDDFLTSTHSTDVKNGSSAPLAIPDAETIQFRYDYWDLLSRWSAVFGRENMICRRYGKSFLLKGNIVDDFLSTVGIEPDGALQRPVSMNESLDADCLDFLRLLNGHMARTERIRKVVAALQQNSKGPLIDLSPNELQTFMGLLRESNRKVAMEYFGGDIAAEGDPLFGPRDTDRPRVPANSLTTERAVEIAATLFSSLKANGRAFRVGQDC